MPSIVKKARNLLRANARNAMRKVISHMVPPAARKRKRGEQKDPHREGKY
jgi:hypothetical protein